MAEALPKKGTNQFMRQGHTDGPFGNSPEVDPKGKFATAPRELKP